MNLWDTHFVYCKQLPHATMPAASAGVPVTANLGVGAEAWPAGPLADPFGTCIKEYQSDQYFHVGTDVASPSLPTLILAGFGIWSTMCSPYSML